MVTVKLLEMADKEENLWKKMLDGDRGAFLQFYQHHYPDLFKYGFSITGDRELTKDALQELFAELWSKKALQNRDVRQPNNYLFTWLRRKIQKLAPKIATSDIDLQKVDGRWKEFSYEELLIAFQTTQEDKDRLQQALAKLTDQQKEVIALKFYEDLSYQQIADRKNLTLRTIYNLVYEGIRRLKETMAIVF